MCWDSAHILAHVLNSASRQHCGIWASQLAFLHGFKDLVSPGEACQHGHINWSLAQAQQHSFIGLSQSFPFKRGGKARPQTVFHFIVQKRPVPGFSGASFAKTPYLESGTEICPSGKKSDGGSVSASPADARKKGAMGVSTPEVSQSTAFSSSSSSVFQVGILLHFLDKWRGITFNRFVLNMVQGYHLQLRQCPPLLHNFWQFNVKGAAAHHPIVQKEVVDLFLREQWNHCLVVLVSISISLWPILNLKQFNHYLHIPSLRFLLSDMSGSLFSMVNMFSPLISRMLIYIFLLEVIIVVFYNLFGIICLISGRFYLLGWPQSLGFHSPH